MIKYKNIIRATPMNEDTPCGSCCDRLTSYYDLPCSICEVDHSAFPSNYRPVAVLC